MNIDFRKVFRASVLTGMTVKNMAGQTLGKIEDVVIDVGSGRLEYAALSCGGFLGVGSKLFAIPWDAFSLKYDEKSTYFLLDLNAAKLQSAPGFDPSHWPDMGDPNWAAHIDAFYRDAQANRHATAVTGPKAATGERWKQPAPAAVVDEKYRPTGEVEEYFHKRADEAPTPPVGV